MTCQIELCGGTERMDSARKVFFADTSMSTYEAQSRPARRMVILRPWQTLDERCYPLFVLAYHCRQNKEVQFNPQTTCFQGAPFLSAVQEQN